MAEESKGSNTRDYRGVDGVVDDADNPPKRIPRGRVGASRPKSPRPGVRDPGKPHEGPDGEKAYGAPISDRPEDRGKK
jgi:hypothetical protein